MRIKRTYAATMREALAQVKLEQGPDAVILGNKKVPGGVEILSAIDFDHRNVDAYAGDPAMPVSSATAQSENPSHLQPAFNQPTALNQPVANEKDFSGLDVGLNIGLGERKEPVLGVESTTSIQSKIKSAAENVPRNQIPKISSPTPITGKSNVSGKSAAGAALTSQASSSTSQKTESNTKSAPVLKTTALPVEEEARLRELQSERLLSSIRDEGFNGQQEAPVRSNHSELQYHQSQAEGINSQPVIDEVKDELKNLRNLMQSQLNVLGWERYNERHPVRSVLLNLMTELGLGTDVCEMIFTELGQFNDDPHKVWQQALGLLAKAIPMAGNDILSDGGRIALVGSTGVGKTTTIAKLAARFAHTHGNRSVALITTDNFRIGAQEQLQHFARMLEIPLLTANDSDELTDRLKMLSDKKLVLIDTAGMSQTDVTLSERFHTLHAGSPDIKPYLVLSANTQLAALNETIKNFSKTRLAGTIVTKLDESASLGGIITTAIRHQLPLSYCGTGQRVPEDLKIAKNHSLVSKAVSLMQKYGEQIDKETLAYRYKNLISNQTV